MTTALSLFNPRQYHTQQIHYLRKAFTFADAATTIDVGVIPSGSLILAPISGVYVTTVFNAGTNNRLDVGASTDTGTNNFGTLLTLLGLGVVTLDELTTVSPKVTTDTAVQAYVDVTGTTATTGAAVIVIAYIPDNDR